MVEKMQKRDRIRQQEREREDKQNTNPIVECLKTWIGRKVVVTSTEKEVEGTLTAVSYTHLNLLVKTDNGEIVFRNFSSVRLTQNNQKPS